MWKNKIEVNDSGVETSSDELREDENKTKQQPGCWAKLKSFFEDTGFDLDYEYDDKNKITSFSDQKDPEAKPYLNNKTAVDRRLSYFSINSSFEDDKDDVPEGNFYEQFAIGEDARDEIKDDWRRLSKPRHRVSTRPSMYLTNIEEESSVCDDFVADVYDLNESRSPPPSSVPPGLIYTQKEPLELLCVFPERTSRVCTAACGAAAIIGGDARHVRTAREALDALRREIEQRTPHVIVIDARQPQAIEALQLARAIRATKFSQHLIIIAVLKKSAYLKDEHAVLPYLEAGFNRIMVETAGQTAWTAELYQARMLAENARAQIGTVAALVAAVDRCRDLVAVTDDQQRILMANSSWCRFLGWRPEEGPKMLTDVVGADALRLSASGHRSWDSSITLKRRGAPDPLLLPCRGAAIALSKNTSHIVLVCDTSVIGEVGVGRGSLHDIIRRGSLDVRSVASDGLRRTSLAKLQGLPLEAPITKVISLLSAATDGAPPSTVHYVELAVDMLRTSELYLPQMRDDTKLRTEDPIATELISALLSQGPTNMLSSRRSSNDSTVVRTQPNRSNIKHKTSGQLRELLDTSLSWDFEIFRLEELTRFRPLVHLGMVLMANRFDVCATLECDEKTFLNWLSVIEMNYHAVNTYHNSTHAADVMQAVAYFLEKDRLKALIEPIEATAALIAAAAHDIDHPGLSSAFLCNSRHNLAVLYNDVSVLESHHAALTFKLTLNDDRVNIFKNLDRETYKTLRHNIIDMILATEMTKHFEHLAKFVNVFYAKTTGSKEDGMQTDEPLALDQTALAQPDNVVLVKRMMIKCADVSNASRPQKFAVEWARRIAEEYFVQTDEEKAKDLPVVMPMFDRASCSIPRSQIGFIEFIILDMMEAWAAFIDMPELITHARNNYLRWKELDEAGVTTVGTEVVKRPTRQHAIQASPNSTTEPTAEED